MKNGGAAGGIARSATPNYPLLSNGLLLLRAERGLRDVPLSPLSGRGGCEGGGGQRAQSDAPVGLLKRLPFEVFANVTRRCILGGIYVKLWLQAERAVPERFSSRNFTENAPL